MSKKNCGRSNEIYIARVPQFSLPCVAQSTRPSVGLGVRRFLPPTGVGESLAREAHHLTIFPCLAIRFKVQLNHLDQSERRREKILRLCPECASPRHFIHHSHTKTSSHFGFSAARLLTCAGVRAWQQHRPTLWHCMRRESYISPLDTFNPKLIHCFKYIVTFFLSLSLPLST